MPKPERKIDPAVAMSMYAAGETVRGIARALGAASSSVYEALQRAGVELRDRRGQPQAKPEPPPEPPARVTVLSPRGDDWEARQHRFAPEPPPGPEGMAPIAVVEHEDGSRETLRAWRPARRDSASRLGATHTWVGEGQPGVDPRCHVEPIAGPLFDAGRYLDPPMVEPRPGANGDGVPESARSRENLDTHAVMAFDLFGNGR